MSEHPSVGGPGDRRHVAVRVTGLALALGIAALLGVRASHPRAAHASAGPPAVAFRPGDRQQYRLRLESAVRLTGEEGGPRSVPQTLRGRLHLRVLDPGPEGARVALQLGEVSLVLAGQASGELDRQLARPFVATFGRDGAARRFEFPSTVGEEARAILEETVRTFQATVPSGAGRAWTAEEEHATGRYRASYRHTSDGRIVRTKTTYLGVAGRSVTIGRSDCTVRITRGASWVERVVLEEELGLLLGQGLHAASTVHAELSLEPRDPHAAPLDLDGADSHRALVAAFAMTEAGPRGAAPSAPGIEPRDLAELIRALDGRKGGGAALLYELRDLLRSDRSAAGRILGRLRAGVPDATAAALINALGMAATEEAQGTLRAVLQDPSFGEKDRSRAALALGGAPEIGNESLAALREAADGSGPLADTSVLALGVAAGTLREAGSTRYEALRADLLGRAAPGRDGSDAAVALLALGNTRDPAVEGAVAARLADPSPAARAASAHALGKVGGPETSGLLVERLALEPDGAVRYRIGASLNALAPPDAAALAAVERAVARERDPQARLELARLLGENLATYPAARAALVALANGDPSQRVRVYAAHTVWGRSP